MYDFIIAGAGSAGALVAAELVKGGAKGHWQVDGRWSEQPSQGNLME